MTDSKETDRPEPCDYCGGTGEVWEPYCMPNGASIREPCPQCSELEPEPLPDQLVDPDSRPESLAERVGRLEREHAELREVLGRSLYAMREACKYHTLTYVEVARDNAQELLDRLQPREGGKGD